MANFWQRLLGEGQRLAAGLTTTVVMGVDTPSSDWVAMDPKWRTINDVMAGGDAIRAAGTRYLPRYEAESVANYNRRLRDAPWRPEWVDALDSLCARPFTKPVTVQATEGNVPDQMQAIVDDVDAHGNALGVLAKEFFKKGVAKGVAALMVDHTRDPLVIGGHARTLADEKAMGVRPYWYIIDPENLLAVYYTQVKGKFVVTYAKVRECGTERDEFGERSYDRIRIMELDAAGKAFWTLYEKQSNNAYVQVDSGEFTIGVIPMVLFFTGERAGNFTVTPPLYELCGVQLELYRAMARESEILNFAGWPNLVFVGMKKPEGDDSIVVGPSVSYYAPHGEAGESDVKYIGPDAPVIEQVAKSPERIMENFRRLAKQPEIKKSGGVPTATESAISGSRAHAAVESWAALLKDALDQALKFTAMWLNLPDTVTSVVQTDFIAHSRSVEEANVLGSAQKRGVISKRTEQSELKRRGILSSDFDPEEEEQQIAKETEGMEPEEEDFEPRGLRLAANHGETI